MIDLCLSRRFRISLECLSLHSSFSQTHKFANIGIIASFVLPHIWSFFLYLQKLMLVCVEIRGCVRRAKMKLVDIVILWKVCEKIIYRSLMLHSNILIPHIYQADKIDRLSVINYWY